MEKEKGEGEGERREQKEMKEKESSLFLFSVSSLLFYLCQFEIWLCADLVECAREVLALLRRDLRCGG